jgi:hypothetical protein
MRKEKRKCLLLLAAVMALLLPGASLADGAGVRTGAPALTVPPSAVGFAGEEWRVIGYNGALSPGGGIYSVAADSAAAAFFISAAGGTGSKSSSIEGDGLVGMALSAGAVKSTIEDSSIQTPDILATATLSTQSGDTLYFGYSGAATGENQYISCVLTDNNDDGALKYYGKLADNSDADEGTFYIPLSGVADGAYTLQIFSEEANGDNDTDFCSAALAMTVAVSGGVGTVSGFEAGGGTIDDEAPVFTAEFAGGEGLPAGTGKGPYQIKTPAQLDKVRNHLGAHYTLNRNIDLTGYLAAEGIDDNGDSGWLPIGNAAYGGGYAGTFDGKGKTISGLKINRSDATGVGLFAAVSGTVRNLKLRGVDVRGGDAIGSLTGILDSNAILSGCSATGAVAGGEWMGTGGLVGRNDGDISGCFAAVDTTGEWCVGGLVGSNSRGAISNSYATGDVAGDWDVGGLAGFNDEGAVMRSYAAGAVTGSEYTGGLLGESYGFIFDCYYDSQASGQPDNEIGTGLDSADMTRKAAYNNWDFNTIWAIGAGTYPYLRANVQDPLPAPFVVTGIEVDPGSLALAYGGAPVSLTVTALPAGMPEPDVTWESGDTSVVTVDGNGAAAAAGAGTTTIKATVAGNPAIADEIAVTVSPKALTVGGSFAAYDKPYDGTTAASINAAGLTLLGADASDSGQVTLGAIVAFDSANAGNRVVSLTGATSLGGSKAGNYTLSLTGAPTASAIINPKPLTVSADTKSKGYGESDPAFTYQITSGSLVTGDSLAGALARASGEDVGPHEIQQGTLTAGTNYTLTYVPSNLVITAKPITVTADAKTKVYGDSDPAFTYQITFGSLVTGDSFTGNLSRETGKSAGSLEIQQGTLTAGTNYILTYVPANLIIGTRPITITADAKSKTVGNPDPVLTYRITEGELTGEDMITGTPERSAGEAVGSYLIGIGSLDAGGNYKINFIESVFTISKDGSKKTSSGSKGTINSGVPTTDQNTGSAATQINASELNAAFESAVQNSEGKKTVEITVPPVQGATGYETSLPAGALTGAGSNTLLEIKTGIADVTLPGNMISQGSAGGASNISLTVAHADVSALDEGLKNQIGSRPVVQLTLSLDGERTDWNNRTAPVTVSISYAPTAEELANPEGIVIWYLDGSGSAVSVPNGRYDPDTGKVTFNVTHFSDYAVAYNQVSFNDVPAGAWYGNAVSFIAARDVTAGTGDGNFSPDAKLTRGQFLVMLMKAYEIAPDAQPQDNFADAGSTYYTGYLAAAKRLGISGGIGDNLFAPEKEITRQEMFTLLYNALKVIGQLPEAGSEGSGGDTGKALTDFSDSGEIASWATEALTFLTKNGTAAGSNNALTPLATTTRAEMAQVLYNLLSKKTS